MGDVPPGGYILSFRWDCEQLPQVWSNCADVKVAVTGKPTKPFSSFAGCEACCTETLGPCANCTQCLNDKSGDCAYCWKPLKGFSFGAIPQYHASASKHQTVALQFGGQACLSTPVG